jgi:DNA polymerase-3 subunit epsilon
VESAAMTVTSEESEIVLRWLERPGTRLVAVSHAWCSPARGAGRLRRWLADPAQVTDPFADRRGLRPGA